MTKDRIASHCAEGLRKADAGEADKKMRRGLHSGIGCARVGDCTINGTVQKVQNAHFRNCSSC